METKAPRSIDAIKADDEALNSMYRIDIENAEDGLLSPEEEQAYRELIDSQRADHIEAHRIEVMSEDGETQKITVRKNIGDKALKEVLAVNSEGWRTEGK